MLPRTTLSPWIGPQPRHTRWKPGWEPDSEGRPGRDVDTTSPSRRTFNSQEDTARDIKFYFISLNSLCIHFLETDLFQLWKGSCPSRVPPRLSAKSRDAAIRGQPLWARRSCSLVLAPPAERRRCRDVKSMWWVMRRFETKLNRASFDFSPFSFRFFFSWLDATLEEESALDTAPLQVCQSNQMTLSQEHQKGLKVDCIHWGFHVKLLLKEKKTPSESCKVAKTNTWGREIQKTMVPGTALAASHSVREIKVVKE